MEGRDENLREEKEQYKISWCQKITCSFFSCIYDAEYQIFMVFKFHCIIKKVM